MERATSDGERHVQQTELGNSVVSTVFLGLDYSFGDNLGIPILYETMVFGGALADEMQRYSTKEQALEGHREMCNRVREAEAPARREAQEMTKHTPGPWRINGTNVFQENALGSVVMIASCGGSVALTYEECQANARLIVDAPETAAERDRLRGLNSYLLVALKGIKRTIKNGKRIEWFSYDEVAELDAAIREAEAQ